MDDPYLKWQLIELSFFEQILRAEHNCLLLSAVRVIKSYFILQIFQTEYLFLSNRPQFYSSFQIKIGLLNTNYYLYLGLCLSYFQTFSWQLRGFQKWLFSTFPILSLVADRWYRSWYSDHIHVYVRDCKPLTFWNNAVHHNATIFIQMINVS